MSAATKTARRSHARPVSRSRGTSPSIPRRVSGPATRKRPTGVPAALPKPQRSTGAPRRASRSSGVLDRLVGGTLWIWVIGVGLGGLVAAQVTLLDLNREISQNVQRAAVIEEQNLTLEEQVAKLSSNDRIARSVTPIGMAMPPAGDIEYVIAGEPGDAARAAARMTAPSQQAIQQLAAAGTPARDTGADAGLNATSPPATPAQPSTETVAAPAGTHVHAPVTPAAAPVAQIPAATTTGTTAAGPQTLGVTAPR